jgi:hypothetical protein
MPATSTATATPSPGAIRAARVIRSKIGADERLRQRNGFVTSEAYELAQSIDRETGLPELAAALASLITACQTPAHRAEGITRAPSTKAIDAARAALARFNART